MKSFDTLMNSNYLILILNSIRVVLVIQMLSIYIDNFFRYQILIGMTWKMIGHRKITRILFLFSKATLQYLYEEFDFQKVFDKKVAPNINASDIFWNISSGGSLNCNKINKIQSL